MEYNDEHFMKQALREAQKAFDLGEIPIGAVLVIDQQIIARAHNQVELLQDPTAHAEVLAITSACDFLAAKYIPEATLYVTIEPCLMCSGALYWSKIGKVVYGATDEKNGYRQQVQKSPFHPKTKIVSGVLSRDCLNLMQDFFRNRR